MSRSLRGQHFLRLYLTAKTSLRFASSSSDRKGLVLGVYSDEKAKGIQFTPAAEKFNQISEGKLYEQIQLAGNEVKPGKSFVFWGLHEEFQAVAVVGIKNKCAPEDECEIRCDAKEDVRVAVAAGVKALDAAGIKNISVEDCCDPESAAEAGGLAAWKFQEYKTEKDELPAVRLYDPNEADCAKWNRGAHKSEAQNIARRLADTPANLLTPAGFAGEAQQLLAPLGMDVKVYDEKWAERQKMFAFLSVARGSAEPPRFLEISYKNKDGKPYVLVGKGVTFDSGGISLKSATKMDEMRADMGGAACLVATLYGLAKLNVGANVKVLIPLVENMPSGSATKPGDVVYARNGKSICVDNTDAEGRLILADALCYGSEFRPEWVLDVATLTGAMVVALGDGATGVFTNCSELYRALERSGSETGDRVWRMPLWRHYRRQVADNRAYDLNNVGRSKGAGGCAAAAFLREFVPPGTKWLHLDAAGVMGPDNAEPYLGRGMSGRPTRTLIDFVERQNSFLMNE